MRSELAVATVLAGCAYTDITEPISIHVGEVSDEDAANLAEAARCWNLHYGTQFQIGGEAPQVVQAFYDNQTCLTAVAQVQVGIPAGIAICPHRYWDSVLQRDGEYGVDATPFRVFSHELGHVLNIVGHPDDPLAVMSAGGYEGEDMFRDADTEILTRFNPNVKTSRGRVTRSHVPHTAIGRCASDSVEPLDATRPIAIDVDPSMPAAWVAELGATASCWNARYRLQLEVRASRPGDQVAFIEPYPGTLGCRFVREQGRVLFCASPDGDPMQAIGVVFGISVFEGFTEDVDMMFATHVPKHFAMCNHFVGNPINGCACLDDPSAEPTAR